MSGRPPDGDFAGFYSLGRILIEHPIKDLYSFELLSRICMEVHPEAVLTLLFRIRRLLVSFSGLSPFSLTG